MFEWFTNLLGKKTEEVAGVVADTLPDAAKLSPPGTLPERTNITVTGGRKRRHRTKRHGKRRHHTRRR